MRCYELIAHLPRSSRTFEHLNGGPEWTDMEFVLSHLELYVRSFIMAQSNKKLTAEERPVMLIPDHIWENKLKAEEAESSKKQMTPEEIRAWTYGNKFT